MLILRHIETLYYRCHAAAITSAITFIDATDYYIDIDVTGYAALRHATIYAT